MLSFPTSPLGEDVAAQILRETNAKNLKFSSNSADEKAAFLNKLCSIIHIMREKLLIATPNRRLCEIVKSTISWI